MTATALAIRLKELSAEDRPLVGGKAASLGELLGAGIPVPPGFVVTSAAFEQMLEHVDPDGAMRAAVAQLSSADRDELERQTARIRDAIVSRPMPETLLDAITEQYHSLSDDPIGPPVAVRSSGTAEDGADASFAGLQDTFLWLRGADTVAEHVRRCWASLYSVESVTYRRDRDIPEDGIAMAVVVQEMVDSRCSGVMFTCSPITGDRSVVAIEGGWGLGSAMVSGEVTPDTYQVNKITGEVIKRVVADKLLQHRADPDQDGVVVEEVSQDLRSVACLTDEEVQALVTVARRVEKHYGSPQDIEWAIPQAAPGEESVILLLQSRPETVWATKQRDKPISAPREKPYDHVLDLLSGGLRKPGGGGK